jgi:hypothetical protein
MSGEAAVWRIVDRRAATTDSRIFREAGFMIVTHSGNNPPRGGFVETTLRTATGIRYVADSAVSILDFAPK